MLLKRLNKLSFWTIAWIGSITPVFAEETVPTEQSVVMQKFLVAIGLVIVCAAFLYGVLFFYKKVFVKENRQIQKEKVDLSLDEPSNMGEAISIFLEKTKTNK